MERNKIVLSVLLVISFSLCFIGIVSAQITNYSFEDGTGIDANGWYEDYYDNHFRSSDMSRTGSYSIKSVYLKPEGGPGVMTISDPVHVQPETTYELSGYIFDAMTSGTAYLDVFETGSYFDPYWECQAERNPDIKNQWERVSCVFTTDPGITSVRIRLVTDGPVIGNVWFDDIALVETSPEPEPEPEPDPVCNYDVDAYGVNVPANNRISGMIRNTGNCTETVSYIFYVNNVIVYEGIATLDPDEVLTRQFSYVFEVYDLNSYEQEFDIRLWVQTNSGEEDQHSMTHVIINTDFYPEGWLNSYRCNGDWRQRLWQFNDGDTEWRNYDYCSYGCTGTACNTKPQENCDVDIRDVDRYSYQSGGETIYAIEVDTRNTGDITETITLKLYVDGSMRKSKSFTLVSGDSIEKIFYLNNLNTDEYAVEVVAQSNCGGSDSEFFILTVGDVPDQDNGCSISINSFDYNNYLRRDDSGWVRMSARNTWSSTETIYMKFYIDGVLKSTFYRFVGVDRNLDHTFYYSPSGLSLGSHQMRIDVYSPKGCLQTRQTTVYVRDSVSPSEPVCNYNTICEDYRGENYINCPYDCSAPQEPTDIDTNVYIYPSSLDIYQYEAKVITLEIDSDEDQNFEVIVTGVPRDWLSYDAINYVERSLDNHVYIYVTPKGMVGNYQLHVSAKALDEGETFSKNIPLYVASARTQTTTETDFTGNIIAPLLTDATLIVSGIIIIIIIVLIIGAVKFREEKTLI